MLLNDGVDAGSSVAAARQCGRRREASGERGRDAAREAARGFRGVDQRGSRGLSSHGKRRISNHVAVGPIHPCFADAPIDLPTERDAQAIRTGRGFQHDCARQIERLPTMAGIGSSMDRDHPGER